MYIDNYLVLFSLLYVGSGFFTACLLISISFFVDSIYIELNSSCSGCGWYCYNCFLPFTARLLYPNRGGEWLPLPDMSVFFIFTVTSIFRVLMQIFCGTEASGFVICSTNVKDLCSAIREAKLNARTFEPALAPLCYLSTRIFLSSHTRWSLVQLKDVQHLVLDAFLFTRFRLG